MYSRLRSLLGIWLLPLAALLFTAPSALSQQQLVYRGCFDTTGTPYPQDTAGANFAAFQPPEGRLQACADFCATGNAAAAQRVGRGEGPFPRQFTNFRKNDNWCFCPNSLVGSRTARTQQQCVGGALTLVYERPTPGGVTGGVTGGTTAGDPLGNIWYESESGWSGMWTRRGTSNVFDAVWSMGAGRVSAVLTIQIQGSAVSVHRLQPNGQSCNYGGTLWNDGRTVSGSYTCQWAPGPFAWNARIDQQPSAAASLGSVWNETELGWTGVWRRRGISSVFDAVWTLGGSRETAVLTMQVQGGVVSVHRRQPNGQTCNYSGVVTADGRSVFGTYTCQWAQGPFQWQATIQP